MNVSLRTALDAIPLSTEQGVAVEVCVTSDAAGDWRTAWMHDGGRRKELFGPARSLREALDAAEYLNGRVWGS